MALRSRLAGWLRQWSVKAARVASTLEPQEADPAPSPPEGPPEHWLRLVVERAPELLEGGGIRAGVADPRADGTLPAMPPMPDVSRPSVPLPAHPVLRSGGVIDSWPRDTRPDRSGHTSSTTDVSTLARAPVESTARRPVSREPVATSRQLLDGRSTRPQPRTYAQPRRSGWRRALDRLLPERIIEARPPVESAAAAPRRPEAAVERQAASAQPAAVEPVWSGSQQTTRSFGRRADHGLRPAGLQPADVVREQGPWDGLEPPQDPRSVSSNPAASDRDVERLSPRWPQPPSDGPWSWTASAEGDRWPALPDDGPLWSLPAPGFTQDRVRRLDDEQRGA